MTTFEERLSRALGAETVTLDPASLQNYALGGIGPCACATPTSVEQVSVAVALAAEAGVPCIPWGGGTRQSYGRPPRLARAPLILRTTALNRVRDYTPDDLAISVEAGMTHRGLSAVLDPHRQFLPLEVPLAARATLGGTLAVDADGPRRHAYGGCRDALVGIEVVEATGRRSKAGGIVVKNVTGFDMMKLYTGSLGSLAVITAANFKLLPVGRASTTVVAAAASLPALFALVDALHASPLVPTACELSDCGWGTQPGWRIAIQAEGLPAAVERHRGALEAMAAQAGLSGIRTLEAGEAGALWARIADFNQAGQGDALIRLAVLPADLARALGVAGARAAEAGLGLRFTARALAGVAYLRVAGDALAEWLNALCATLPGANIVALDAAQALPDALRVGAPPAGRAVMAALKTEFDPNNLLNPGRALVDAEAKTP